MTRRWITAKELGDRLAKDPDYQRRMAEKRAQNVFEKVVILDITDEPSG